MCGRFSNATTPDQLKASFKVQFGHPQLGGAATGNASHHVGHNAEPRWNIAPSLDVDTVIYAAGQRILRPMTWGIATLKNTRPIINARSETMFEKPTFRHAARSQRCLVVASGWYEWIGRKKPYYISRVDGAPMGFAGLYWQDGNSSRCVIVTTAADGALADIHHRAPRVVETSDMDGWLSGEMIAEHGGLTEIGEKLVAPSNAELFTWHPVSAEVGSTRINHSGLIERDDAQGMQAIEEEEQAPPPEQQLSLF